MSEQQTIHSKRYQCPECGYVYDVTTLPVANQYGYKRAGFCDFWFCGIGDGRVICPHCDHHDRPNIELREVSS